MKILLVNKFFFLRGGAEASLFDTARLLRDKGHRVLFFSMRHPRNIASPFSRYFVSPVDFSRSASVGQKLKASLRILYSFEARRMIDRLLKKERPDLVHLHNIYHQISPSILRTIKNHGLPAVMTLHDYKMVCAVYTLFNRGKVCERCARRKFTHCLSNACRWGSRSLSLLNTLEMVLHHSILGLYDLIDGFISPSLFLKDKLREMGFKGEIHYLPHFINLSGYEPSPTAGGDSLVYAGRLSPEKGLFTLLRAVQRLDCRVKIFGEGPLRGGLEQQIRDLSLTNVSLLGHKSQEELKREIKNSRAVILPSEWYENNSRAVIEAFALGKPVIGARIGGIPELVRDGLTGRLFEPGNSEDLRRRILELIEDPETCRRLGREARAFAERRFRPDDHYTGLMHIYGQALAQRQR
jgi:glycosyltransferase involved in cell wall biosynthesis